MQLRVICLAQFLRQTADALAMDVGVYIDGYNLYYGGRKRCGRGTPGWRWLDLRRLGERLLSRSPHWSNQGGAVNRVVYCTAKVDGGFDSGARRDQDTYHAALVQSQSVDHIEFGKFVTRAKAAPLATRCHATGRPQITTPRWPITVRDQNGDKLADVKFVVGYQHTEEKGSDVNVASLLLQDVFERRINAAIVITNDSDLRTPLRIAREHVHVATINPQPTRLAAALMGDANAGVGSHWWYQMMKTDFTQSQLSNPAGSIVAPQGW